MSAIELDQITRVFGKTPALNGIDLRVEAGAFVAIVGRSGSGKSTLLRVIAGLEKASSGAACASDSIAMAFQEARLLPWLKVVDNVGFGLSGAAWRATALAALDEVGLSEKAGAWPLTLSGGQAQRVSLARALVRQPDILLLDEPFGSLDALTRLEMQNLVNALWRKHGWTVVMVTHDVTEAIRLADRVVVLDKGVILDQVEISGPSPRDIAEPEHARLARHLLQRLGVALAE